MKRIGVLTSGGDAPGMNAAIRSAVRCAVDRGMEIYGIHRGYEGLIEGELEPLNSRSVCDILQVGGTMLKTARSKRFMTEEGMDKALTILDTFGIEGLIAIGGDGTLHGARELSRRGVTVMGLPGTIDNDLAYTDYTIGFDTAVATVLDAITKIRDTSSSHDRVIVVEVMGRNCGDIALYAGLTGGAEEVLVPELPYDLNALCQKLIIQSNAGKMQSIIIRAEGAAISTQDLVDEIIKRTGRDCKQVVLSYLQRGGSPTMFDRLLATMTASKAVELLEEGAPSQAIGTLEGRIVAVDLEEALEKKREINRNIFDLIKVLSI